MIWSTRRCTRCTAYPDKRHVVSATAIAAKIWSRICLMSPASGILSVSSAHNSTVRKSADTCSKHLTCLTAGAVDSARQSAGLPPPAHLSQTLRVSCSAIPRVAPLTLPSLARDTYNRRQQDREVSGTLLNRLPGCLHRAYSFAFGVRLGRVCGAVQKRLRRAFCRAGRRYGVDLRFGALPRGTTSVFKVVGRHE